MEHYQIKAKPFLHQDLDIWRENFKGIKYEDRESGFTITGAIDDVWINDQEELIIVDYKATAKDGEVSLDADWQDGYKRQMEVYQWLFIKNGFKVSPTGYFVYCNGIRDKQAFDAKLEFNIKLIPHTGQTDWIEPTLRDIKKCLDAETIPAASENCDYCKYRQITQKVEKKPSDVMVAEQVEKKEKGQFSSGKLF